MLPVELSGASPLRAATRYLVQYDPWHRYEPPRITFVLPGTWAPPAVNASAHHSHTFPVMLWSP